MIKKYPTILGLLAALLFTTCKKGEDDPTFSLRTRTARVEGEWRMASGKAAITVLDPKSTPYNCSYAFDGASTTFNETEYGGGMATIYTFGYTVNIHFTKKGTFTMWENYGGVVMDASGTWSFAGGGEDSKKKEEIVLKILEVRTSQPDEHLFNQLGTDFTFKIKELRNKKMVLEGYTKLFIQGSGKQANFSSEYILIQ